MMVCLNLETLISLERISAFSSCSHAEYDIGSFTAVEPMSHDNVG